MQPVRMRQKIAEIRARLEESWAFASERLFHESMDTYFVFEEHLEQIGQVLAQIESEIEQAEENDTLLRRLTGRLAFLDDHFEEVDSGARNRPRRRSRINLGEFFRRAGGQNADGDEIREVFTLDQAFQELGLSNGTDMRTVTAVFRKLVKQLHPDARGGDRSTEPQLRKVVAAYEYLKRMARQT